MTTSLPRFRSSINRDFLISAEGVPQAVGFEMWATCADMVSHVRIYQFLLGWKDSTSRLNDNDFALHVDGRNQSPIMSVLGHSVTNMKHAHVHSLR